MSSLGRVRLEPGRLWAVRLARLVLVRSSGLTDYLALVWLALVPDLDPLPSGPLVCPVGYLWAVRLARLVLVRSSGLTDYLVLVWFSLVPDLDPFPSGPLVCPVGSGPV